MRGGADPVPAGFVVDSGTPMNAAELADGRIVFGVNTAGNAPDATLTFDPRRSRFAAVAHPAGRSVRMLWPSHSARGLGRDSRRAALPSGALRRNRLHRETRRRNALGSRACRAPSSSSAATIWCSCPTGSAWASCARAGTRSSAAPRDIRGRDRLPALAVDARHLTPSGLHRYRDGGWMTVGAAEGLPDGSVNDLLEERSGRLWVGTTAGLSRTWPTRPRRAADLARRPRQPDRGAAERRRAVLFSGRDRWNDTLPERLLYAWRLDGGRGRRRRHVPHCPDLVAGTAPDRRARHRPQLERRSDAGRARVRGAAAVVSGVGLPRGRRPGALGLVRSIGSFVSRHVRLERLVGERTTALAEANEQLRLNSPIGSASNRSARGSRASCTSRRSSKRSAGWPAASRTISTTCSR